MNLRISSLLIMTIILGSCGQKKESRLETEKNPDVPWLLGFEKTDKNPIMIPDSTFVFTDPMTGNEVQWQKADVFNPGAIVRNDTVFLLFRAEDNPNAILGGAHFPNRFGL